MPSDPFTFTDPLVLGAPRCQWRAVRGAGMVLRIERRELPAGAWVEQTTVEVAAEVEHGTEAGRWLGRLRAAGMLA